MTKPNATRSRILAAARRHFFAFGFQNVTLADLAAELGISKKTFYVHFSSKSDLLNAMLDTKLADVDKALAAAFAGSTLPFAKRLQKLLRTVREEASEIQAPFVRDVRQAEPELFERVRTSRQKLIRKHFGRLLEEGRKARMIRTDIPVDFLIATLVGAVDSVVIPATMEEFGLTPNVGLSRVVSIFLEGALVREEAS